MLNRQSLLWEYLSAGQKGLIETGEFLLSQAKTNDRVLTDYAYLVFPFAKAYEGFLKQLFLDRNFIDKNQYESDHFRIGKALNPNLVHEEPNQSVYLKITNFCHNNNLANTLWNTWKRGRNLLFHYFPQNLNSINLDEAEATTKMIIHAMEEAFISLKPQNKHDRLNL